MPIKIPNSLPATGVLESENIFVITESRAISQDIRPLHILLLNLMPTKVATETQLARVLGNTPLQVELELLQVKSHESKNVSQIEPEEYQLHKDGVYLINYARGPVLDNDAVCDAIENGKIAGFATDFPTARQLGYENALCTPHLGAGTPEADENCSVMAARQICDYLENGNISHSVNFPDVSFARAEGDRSAVERQGRRHVQEREAGKVVDRKVAGGRGRSCRHVDGDLSVL